MSNSFDARQTDQLKTRTVFGYPERGEAFLWNTPDDRGFHRFVPSRSRSPVLTGTTRGILKKFFLELFCPCPPSKNSKNTNEPVGPG